MAAIEIGDLTKRFGAVRVLEGLNLRVGEGEVYGLLGPNGAGKTTLIYLILGFLRPNSGRVQVLGVTPDAARGRLGYLPERVRYHAHFTAREYLQALGALSDLRGGTLARRCREVLELVGLWGDAERRIGYFSKGMLQRLGIAQALLHDPGLLLVDEPTSGLDPAGQREVIDLLVQLRRQGHTILICTHQLSEVEELCDRVGILRGSRLAAEARLSELAQTRGVSILVRGDELPETLAAELCTLGQRVEVAGREIRIGSDGALQNRVLRLLLDAGLGIAEVKPAGNGIEELYLSVTRGGPPGQGVANG